LQAEERHARLAARLSGLLDSAMDAIITVDDSQRIVLYNRAAEKIFGWTTEEALGQPLSKLMPERFRSGHGAYVQRFGSTGVTSRRMGDNTVVYGRRADGEEFPMEASISQLKTADGKLFTVILRDVTERVRAQEERSAFAAAAHAIREEEKTRVARELHDELAQSLTALKMDTIWLRDNAGEAPDKLQPKLADMLSMLDRAVASTRRIAADLRPLMLDDLGLVPAIEWLVSNFSQRSGVETTLKADEELELREPYATAVFRIVQDLSMPGRSGMELIKLVRAEKPKLRILVLSMHQELQYAVRAIKSGASGYLTKESAPAELEQAIRKIAGGGAYVTPEVAEQLALGAMPGSTASPHESLSDREFEVFRMLAAGASVTDIATRLKLSVKTVSTHKANLMHKMGLQNASELVRYAIKHGLADNLDA
jgi:PAS domain S-box-containing protein